MREIKLETQYIHFVFSLLGQHYYPGHPTLNTPHCHQFVFGVLLETFEDRGIEFIAFRNLIKQSVMGTFKIATKYTNDRGQTVVRDFDTRSCEMLGKIVAQIVAKNLPDGYPEAEIQVTVCESEEHAAGLWKGKILATES